MVFYEPFRKDDTTKVPLPEIERLAERLGTAVDQAVVDVLDDVGGEVQQARDMQESIDAVLKLRAAVLRHNRGAADASNSLHPQASKKKHPHLILVFDRSRRVKGVLYIAQERSEEPAGGIDVFSRAEKATGGGEREGKKWRQVPGRGGGTLKHHVPVVIGQKPRLGEGFFFFYDCCCTLSARDSSS